MERTDVVESIISSRFRLFRASSTTAINDTCFPKKHLKDIGMQDKQHNNTFLSPFAWCISHFSFHHIDICLFFSASTIEYGWSYWCAAVLNFLATKPARSLFFFQRNVFYHCASPVVIESCLVLLSYLRRLKLSF